MQKELYKGISDMVWFSEFNNIDGKQFFDTIDEYIRINAIGYFVEKILEIDDQAIVITEGEFGRLLKHSLVSDERFRGIASTIDISEEIHLSRNGERVNLCLVDDSIYSGKTIERMSHCVKYKEKINSLNIIVGYNGASREVTNKYKNFSAIYNYWKERDTFDICYWTFDVDTLGHVRDAKTGCNGIGMFAKNNICPHCGRKIKTILKIDLSNGRDFHLHEKGNAGVFLDAIRYRSYKAIFDIYGISFLELDKEKVGE